MDEKEKMVRGDFYDPMDRQLITERMKTRKLLHTLNHSSPVDQIKRRELFKELFGKIGDDFFIEPPFYCDYGYNIEIGEDFSANFNCIMLDVTQIIIGDGVSLGPGVHIYTATHPTEPKERLAKTEYGKKIIIEDNVWIGGGAVISPGIKIGSNSTVGAGSVVIKDIPEDVIAVGNPCEVIKRFDEERR